MEIEQRLREAAETSVDLISGRSVNKLALDALAYIEVLKRPRRYIEKSFDEVKWHPIATKLDTDDLMWFLSGKNNIDGPQKGQYDDIDRYDYWAECTYPPTDEIEHND